MKICKLITITAFIFLGITVKAGDKIPGKYEKGTITLSNGKTKEAYIHMDYFYPQRFQTELTYLDEKGYKDYQKGKKVKKSIIKLKLKEIDGFSLENGKKFKKVKYANMLATKTLDMIPKYLLLEVVAEGKVTIYKKHYRTTGRVYDIVLKAYNNGGQEFIDFQNDNFELLYQKDKTKNPKNMITVNLKTLIGDNEEVLTNYNNNHYGFQSEFTKERDFAANVHTPYLETLLKLLEDYNK